MSTKTARTSRTPPITHVQKRELRSAIAQFLHEQPEHRWVGSLRSFAREIAKQFGPNPPFNLSADGDSALLENRISATERGKTLIAFTWGKSHNYPCVEHITLVDASAVDPPTLTRPQRAPRANAQEREFRQWELLDVLVTIGGRAESTGALAREVAYRYPDRREAVTRGDCRALAQKKYVTMTIERVLGRTVHAVVLTKRGERALAKHRDANDGWVRPRAPSPTPEAGATGAPTRSRLARAERHEQVLAAARRVLDRTEAFASIREFRRAVETELGTPYSVRCLYQILDALEAEGVIRVETIEINHRTVRRITRCTPHAPEPVPTPPRNDAAAAAGDPLTMLVARLAAIAEERADLERQRSAVCARLDALEAQRQRLTFAREDCERALAAARQGATALLAELDAANTPSVT